jgi:hypothetical protein
MWWNIRVVGTRIYRGLNFHTTTATKKVENGTVWGIIWTTMPHTAQLDRTRKKAIFGPDIIVEAEATVRRIQENLKAAKLH